MDTPVTLTHVNPEKKKENSVIRKARKGTHKYNTRYKVNHVTTFKNTPQMFKNDMADTSTTHIGSDYITKTDPKKDTIIVEPVEHQIARETTGNILGYRGRIHQYGKTPRAKNLAVCPRFGKYILGLIQSNLSSINTNKRKEGQHMWERYVRYDHKKRDP